MGRDKLRANYTALRVKVRRAENQGLSVLLNIFDFTISRHRDGPDLFLIDHQYQGTLVGDCYGANTGTSIAEQWYSKTALPDLLGVPVDRVDDNRLYRTLDQLLPHKEQLEVQLKERMGQLFVLEYGGSSTDDPASSDGADDEIFILCRSRDRSKKEEAMVGRSEDKIEERRTKMTARCEKQKRDPMKVEREIGRLLGQNTRAARLFEVNVSNADDGRAQIEWKKVKATRDWAALSAGCDLLRTNVTDWSDEDLWKAYIQLTEAEAAFCIHESDLKIRPIWHQKEDRVAAHILVCFLAYVLWKTLAQMCAKAGLGNEPRRILAELSELRMMDVVLPTREGVDLRRRCVNTPTEHQQILLDHLGLRLPKIIQTDL